MVNKTLNNTLEEELRIQLVDQLKTINALKSEIDMLKNTVKEEQDQKYRAYVKISDLQRELNKS
jgi:hypothetical protein